MSKKQSGGIKLFNRKYKKNILILLCVLAIIGILIFSNAKVNAAEINGWNQKAGIWYYYKNDVMETGWIKDSGTWYYLNAGGDMATGWVRYGSKWYFLNSNGAMAANKWIRWNNGKQYFVYSDGSMAVNTVIDGWTVNGDGAWDGKVQVNDVVVTALSLNKTVDSLAVGRTDNLIAIVTPSNATNKNVKWTSSNPTVAKVDNTGKVTAISVGTTIITTTSDDGSKIARCEVEINTTEINGWDSKAGVWYYYQDGVMKTGWTKYFGKWYFLDSNGVMAENKWIKWSDGKQYFVNSNGSMAVNTVIDGWIVNANGAWDGNGQIKINSIIKNDDIILAGKATGFKINGEGGKNLLYQLNVYNYATKCWKEVSGYSSNPNFKWVFDTPGSYQVLASVKDASSSNKYDFYLTIEVNVIVQDIRIDDTNIDTNNILELGQSVEFKSLPLNINNKLYQFNIYDYITKQWSALTEYRDNNKLTYTFNRSGRFQVLCSIKDKNSTNRYDTYGRINISVSPINITQEPGTIYEKCKLSFDDMVDAQSNSSPVYWDSGNWPSASKEQVKYYVDPSNFMSPLGKLQFVLLNYTEGISASDLNIILSGKGILDGKGQAFLNAAKDFNINPVYLVAHALLETGNGKSDLANGGQIIDGKYVYGKPVYNMFGIGAYDYDPTGCGTQMANEQKWFTPEDAIYGGAGFISKRYINNSTYNQNTLYKMRWNPLYPVEHQYATDIAWAYNQTYTMKKLFDKIPNVKLIYNYPIYR